MLSKPGRKSDEFSRGMSCLSQGITQVKKRSSVRKKKTRKKKTAQTTQS